MKQILHLRFLGARAFVERKRLGLKHDLPLVVVRKGIVVDCDQKAWKQGVRWGDTLRQAKIAAPSSQVIQELRGGSLGLEPILEVFSSFTPYIQPDTEIDGVFVSLFKDTSVDEVLRSLRGMSYYTFCGISSSKLVSKAASTWAFRNLGKSKNKLKDIKWGTVIQKERYVSVSVGQEKRFLSGLPLDFIWMLPQDVVLTLKNLGLKKIKDIHNVPVSELEKQIGDWALTMKEWSCGKDFSRVKQIYPPPRFVKTIEVQAAISQLDENILTPRVEELSDYLFEEGLGLKKLTLELSGQFPDASCNKSFTSPTCTKSAIGMAAFSMLKSLVKDLLASYSHSAVSTVTLIARDMEAVHFEQRDLWAQSKISPTKTKQTAIPKKLGLAMMSVQEKFGDTAISWGREKERDKRFDSGIIRRERMLAMWDPMRAMLQAIGDVGGVR